MSYLILFLKSYAQLTKPESINKLIKLYESKLENDNEDTYKELLEESQKIIQTAGPNVPAEQLKTIPLANVPPISGQLSQQSSPNPTPSTSDPLQPNPTPPTPSTSDQLQPNPTPPTPEPNPKPPTPSTSEPNPTPPTPSTSEPNPPEPNELETDAIQRTKVAADKASASAGEAQKDLEKAETINQKLEDLKKISKPDSKTSQDISSQLNQLVNSVSSINGGSGQVKDVSSLIKKLKEKIPIQERFNLLLYLLE